MPGPVGCSADAWSFGAVVYTLLVGFPPFFPHAGGLTGELKEQIRSGVYGFPAEYWQPISPEVCARERLRARARRARPQLHRFVSFTNAAYCMPSY
jgi:hypothetical protein